MATKAGQRGSRMMGLLMRVWRTTRVEFNTVFVAPQKDGSQRTGGWGDSLPQEFQVTWDSCFLRVSHSAPERMRGATSIRRGVSLKTVEAFQGRPSRVRYSRTFKASAMLVKEMSWTIISARNLRVCISSGSSS